jgi:predicted nucleic acid-binding protein
MATHDEVVELVRERLHERGIGWIDAHLLASALLGDLPLWTADPRLAAVAREIDVAYEGVSEVLR